MQLTSNLNLKKPEATDNVNIDDLNDNADALDAAFSVVATAVTTKVDKVAGKGLSTEDYTTAEKTKLSGVAAGAQVNRPIASQVQAEAGTDNATDMTPLRVAQAIVAQAVSALKIEAKHVNDSGDTYPLGVTVMTVNTGTWGFPFAGIAITERVSAALAVQTLRSQSNGSAGQTAHRNWRSDSGWSSWVRMIDEAYGDGRYLRLTQVLANGFNLNTLMSDGRYRGLSLTNAPNGLTNWFVIDVHPFSDANGGTVLQIATTVSGTRNQRFMRSSYQGSWSTWIRIIDETYGDGRYARLTGADFSGAVSIGGITAVDMPSDVTLYLRRSGVNKSLFFNANSSKSTILRTYNDSSTSQYRDLVMHYDGTFTWTGNNIWHAGGAPSGTSGGNTRGYQKFPSGVIIQWGYSTPPGTGEMSVTLPIAFTSTNFAITLTPRRIGPGHNPRVTVVSQTTTNFVADLQYSGSPLPPYGFAFAAIGI